MVEEESGFKPALTIKEFYSKGYIIGT